jgi:hypothetical protein
MCVCSMSGASQLFSLVSPFSVFEPLGYVCMGHILTVKQHAYHLHRYLQKYQQEFIVDNTEKGNPATCMSI